MDVSELCPRETKGGGEERRCRGKESFGSSPQSISGVNIDRGPPGVKERQASAPPQRGKKDQAPHSPRKPPLEAPKRRVPANWDPAISSSVRLWAAQ